MIANNYDDPTGLWKYKGYTASSTIETYASNGEN